MPQRGEHDPLLPLTLSCLPASLQFIPSLVRITEAHLEPARSIYLDDIRTFHYCPFLWNPFLDYALAVSRGFGCRRCRARQGGFINWWALRIS